MSILVFVALQGLAQAAVAIRVAVTGDTIAQAAHSVVTDPVMLACGQALAFTVLLGIGVALFRDERSVRETLGIEATPPALFFVALLGGFAMSLCLSELSNVLAERFPIPLETQLIQHTLLNPNDLRAGIGAVAAFALVAPLGEELLFRGLLLPGLRDRYGRVTAIVVTAVFFGLLHGFRPTMLAPTILAGALLGVVALRTGSVLPAVALHMGNNALPLLITEDVLRVDGFNTISEEVQHLDVWVILTASAALVAAVSYIFAATSGPTAGRGGST